MRRRCVQANELWTPVARLSARGCGVAGTGRRQNSLRKELPRSVIVPTGHGQKTLDDRVSLNVTRCPGIPSHPQVYQGAFRSRCCIFPNCCNMRGAGKLRHKIFWACFASQSSFRRRQPFGVEESVERRELSGVELPGQIRPRLNSRMGYFFGVDGVDPKKVSLILLHRSTLCQTNWPPRHWFIFHKACGANDLERLAGTLSSHSSPRRRSPRPTFLACTPKKSPFLSAPKKPKKSEEARGKSDPSPPAPLPQGARGERS
jgi:hypothetical protein